MAAEVLRHSLDGRPAAAAMARTAASWSKPISTTSRPPGARSRRGVGKDAAVGIEPVRAAVEGAGGIVVADLGRKGRDRARGDIGRIGDDQLEGLAERRAPVAGDEGRAQSATPFATGVAGAPSRAPRASGRRRSRGRPAARAGARPEDNPSRCRDRECAGRAARSGMAASAASTTVSVSGRGTSVSGESAKGRPQNSCCPRMRATGSWTSRRATWPSKAPRLRRRAARPGDIASAAASTPSASQRRMRASRAGLSRPASVKARRSEPE